METRLNEWLVRQRLQNLHVCIFEGIMNGNEILYFLIADQQVTFEKLNYMSLFFEIHNQQNMYISLSETLI